MRAWKGSAATAERRSALTKRISERLRWLLDAEDALTAYRLEEVAAAWQNGDDERAGMLLDDAGGWLGITALLDSVPLAASFAEARRTAKTGETVPERRSDEEREPTAAELAEIEAERY